MSRISPGLVLCLLGLLASCGGASAQAPFNGSIGTTRAQLVEQLRGAYCQGPEEPSRDSLTETFPRCDAPGAEYAQSWVVAYFDEGGLVMKLQRWEKYAEADRALERFNELVEKRSQAAGGPSDAAKQQIGSQEQLPAGTRTWVAFPRDETALVGVYLLDPSPPEYANVLEQIVEIQSAR